MTDPERADPVIGYEPEQLVGFRIGVTSDKVFPTWIRPRIDLNNPRLGANDSLLHIPIAFGQWLG